MKVEVAHWLLRYVLLVGRLQLGSAQVGHGRFSSKIRYHCELVRGVEDRRGLVVKSELYCVYSNYSLARASGIQDSQLNIAQRDLIVRCRHLEPD